jgi:predicted TIM-barrel fold metal-dependent hydrolase
MVTVSHCHVGSVGFGSKNSEAGTIPSLARIIEKCGVERAVVFAPFPEVGLGWGGRAAELFNDPNEWLLKEIRHYPNLFGLATINPREPDAAERLRSLAMRGLVGAKVHPAVHGITINDPAIDGYFKVAEDLRLPIHIHTGVHGGFLRSYLPTLIDDVAQRHPELPIILDHVGGYALFHEALAVLHNPGNVNCYVGLTQCSGRDPLYQLTSERVDVLLRTVGARRIIYGLDYPWNEDNLDALKCDLAWVRSWQITDQEKNDILGGNIERLIRQGVRARTNTIPTSGS